MTKDYPRHNDPRKPAPTAPVCLDCHRARRAGKPWGCLVHVAEGVL